MEILRLFVILTSISRSQKIRNFKAAATSQQTGQGAYLVYNECRRRSKKNGLKQLVYCLYQENKTQKILALPRDHLYLLKWEVTEIVVVSLCLFFVRTARSGAGCQLFAFNLSINATN